MAETSTTEFVPSSDEYTAPERPFDRLRAITAKLQPVDGQGHDIPRKTPDPTVTAVVEPGAPSEVVNMSTALALAVAKVPGADLASLMDSTSFLREIGPISAADSLALIDLVRAHTPAPTAPRMQSNPAQHTSGASVPTPSSGSVLERLQKETAKALNQPEPPGSTYQE